MSVQDTRRINWASKMNARHQMFLIEWHKLRPLRETPWTGTTVDDEIDRDIEYWEAIHAKWLAIYRGKTLPDSN